jgi:hypothetical protein
MEKITDPPGTKAPEGTTTGVAAGGTIGGTLGLLAGIGALAIPGLHCDTSEEINRAKDVLKRTGAEDIASAGEEAVGATPARDANKR